MEKSPSATKISTISFLNNKPRHAEWRKQAKKTRRKRIRTLQAKLRDKDKTKSTDTIDQSETETESARLRLEAEESAAAQENWLRIEMEAQKQFRELQKKLEAARSERAEQNARIKKEWQAEQERQKIIQDAKEEDLKVQQEIALKRSEALEHYIENGGTTPEHLRTCMETNPGKTVCPFFNKTAACRFYEACSRNHIRPTASATILIANLYSHYSLEKSENEHGTDSNLEFEHGEIDEHYRDFFLDVIPEMEKCGRIRLFRTCCNHEAHLRGNVYVEFESMRDALKSYRVFNGRFYGGKQLSVQFCKIPSWKSAICGLYFGNRCPKGNGCNFLHVFRNPQGRYSTIDRPINQYSEEVSERRHWRWSESPDRLEIRQDSDKHKSRHRKKSRKSSSKSRKRSRSRSNKSKKTKRRHKSSSRRSHD